LGLAMMNADATGPARPRSGTSKLRARARLISLIGEDLISDEPVALVELVKNAYDADATRVIVRFEGKSTSRIVVQDDGHGMDLKTVLETWFEPGTPSKKETDRSPRGRIYQGAKGIGRFASARLARSLYLESRVSPEADGVMVLFDWGAFDDESYLDQVEIAWEVGEAVALRRGTRLTLEGLRKRWEEKDYEELHSRLSRLISPFNEVSEFEIVLDIPGHPQLSGTVQPPELLSYPRYQLDGTVSSDGHFRGALRHNGKAVREYKKHKLGGVDQRPGCGPFSVEIRVWDRDREGLATVADVLNQGINQIRRTLDNYSGVSIYRDGFRVYPYGQHGNDWLRLDNRSRQNPVRRLANNQIVAAIQISRDSNPELRDRSTREGLVLNDAYRELEAWFTEVLSMIEEYRYSVRPRRPAPASAEPLFEAFDLGEAVRQVRATLGPSHPVTGMVAQLEAQVSEGVERIQEVFSRLLMSAGLGQMVDVVIHEIGAPLGKITRQIDLLDRAARESSDPQLVASVVPMITSINGWLEQIHNLRQRLDPQTAGRRGRATSFNVRDEVEDTFRLYGALLDGQRIKWRIDSPEEPIRVFMARSALGQVLANLVDNAIFWLVRTKGVGKGGTIVATMEPREHGFAIFISDDGPGVMEEDRSEIFEPYFTRKPNGMGLGLYIARLVIEPYGHLVYRDDCKLSGACFEAVFDHGVGL
jgi:signal transduction histidine kinase